MNLKALVADDSDVMRKVLAGYLREMGIPDIEHACDGAEALVKGKAGGHDLILLDWNMPKMLGIDVLRRLKASGIEAPVVIVTTEANKMNVIEAVKSGASNYIMKPFQRDTFVSRIQQTLAKAGRPLP